MGKSDKTSKKKDAFNTPFKGLKQMLKEQAPKPAPAPPKPAPRPAPVAPPDEGLLFAQAMAGVKRIEDPRGHAPPPPPRPVQITSDEAEALAQLSELVSGDGPFDISDTLEYIEGTAPGVDRRILQTLKRGDYALQGHLDLHGLTKAEAKEAVDRFLTESRRVGKRCVLLIHGRGLNSKDQIPVLKEQLKVWLNRGRIGRSVLAFATARPHDGGAGALYVLLRR